MDHLPLPIIGFFLFTALLALIGFGKAVRGSKTAIVGSVLWMSVDHCSLRLLPGHKDSSATPIPGDSASAAGHRHPVPYCPREAIH
jgi:hypothetical protein